MYKQYQSNVMDLGLQWIQGKGWSIVSDGTFLLHKILQGRKDKRVMVHKRKNTDAGGRIMNRKQGTIDCFPKALNSTTFYPESKDDQTIHKKRNDKREKKRVKELDTVRGNERTHWDNTTTVQNYEHKTVGNYTIREVFWGRGRKSNENGGRQGGWKTQ